MVARTPVPMAPLLGSFGVPLEQPLSEAREPAALATQGRTLAAVLLSERGHFLGLTGGKHAAGGVQESAPFPPGSVQHVDSLAAVTLHEASPLVTLLLDPMLSLTGPLPLML